MTPRAAASWPWPDNYDFFETTRLLRIGGNDPTMRREPDGFWRTTRVSGAPVTVRVRARHGECIDAEAWGDTADDALAAVSDWLGLHESAWSLPAHPVTDRLLRERPGLRLSNTGDVYEALVGTILQQRVTWNEAAFTWRRVVTELGDAAPGPAGLRVLPAPRRLYAAGVERLVRLGIARQQAVTLNETAFAATRLQRAADLPTAQAARLLEVVRGIGPWTSASVLGLRLGRPEPVVFGDVHLPHTVCWALAGEPRGCDERMAELLAPFAGQAFRVLRLLFAARIEAPRRGPRRAPNFGPR